MLRVPTLAIHAAAVALSAAAHAAVLVAVGGHGRTPTQAATDDRIVETEIEATPGRTEPVDDDEPEHRSTPAAPAAYHAHTHPYPVAPSHDSTPHDPSLVHVPGAAPPPAPSPDVASAAAPALTAEALPRFTIAVPPGPATGAAAAPSAPAGAAGTQAGQAEADGPPLPERSVSTPARLLIGATPAYPSAARSQGVEADVPLELVVSRAGTVESARVTQHAGFGFDEAALTAVRAYRFTPAAQGGRPTRVVMRWTMQFRLR